MGTVSSTPFQFISSDFCLTNIIGWYVSSLDLRYYLEEKGSESKQHCDVDVLL
jgi:hypothetical protein